MIDKLREKTRLLTAEKIYRILLDEKPSPQVIAEMRNLFAADDHAVWYMPERQQTLIAEIRDLDLDDDKIGNP